MTTTESKHLGATPDAKGGPAQRTAPFITAQDPDTLLKPQDAALLVGLSVSSLYKKANKNLFPKPIKLSTRCTRWRSGDVRDWIRAQAKAQGAQQ